MEISVKDFLSKCEQIRKKFRICLHLVKKSLAKNFIFCVVLYTKFGISTQPEMELTGKLDHSFNSVKEIR